MNGLEFLHFAVYEKSSGKVISSLTGTRDSLVIPDDTPEFGYVFAGTVSPLEVCDNFYVAEGRLVRRPQLKNVKFSNSAMSASSALLISGLPPNSVLSVKCDKSEVKNWEVFGIDKEIDMEENDEAEITFSIPGTYSIAVKSFPFVDLVKSVEVYA